MPIGKVKQGGHPGLYTLNYHKITTMVKQSNQLTDGEQIIIKSTYLRHCGNKTKTNRHRNRRCQPSQARQVVIVTPKQPRQRHRRARRVHHFYDFQLFPGKIWKVLQIFTIAKSGEPSSGAIQSATNTKVSQGEGL